MDINKYDILRKKNNKKDFEQRNKGLDKWLFGLSFLGNIFSIFFSIFLVYPGFLKAIEINVIDGFVAKIIAFISTLSILIAFEVIKRYIIKNFSHEYVKNKLVIKSTSWLSVSILIIILSFYTSLYGSKNLGSIGKYNKGIIENKINSEKDKLVFKSELEKKPKLNYIQDLISINNDINQRLEKTPLSWESIKNGYRDDIKNNDNKIADAKKEINIIDSITRVEISKLDVKQNDTYINIETEDIQNIVLFIIIAITSEIIIFCGIYFREWYEYKLLLLNEQKYEKIYLKRDRYRSLVTFIYGDGKLNIGDKVISGLEIKELIKEKTMLTNSNKIIDDFFKDMDKMGIFTTVGKRRYIAMAYSEALLTIENYDDTLRILENIK